MISMKQDLNVDATTLVLHFRGLLTAVPIDMHRRHSFVSHPSCAVAPASGVHLLICLPAMLPVVRSVPDKFSDLLHSSNTEKRAASCLDKEIGTQARIHCDVLQLACKAVSSSPPAPSSLLTWTINSSPLVALFCSTPPRYDVQFSSSSSDDKSAAYDGQPKRRKMAVAAC